MDEGHCKIDGQGTVEVPLGNRNTKVTAKHAPHFTENLISLSKIVKQGYRAVVDDDDEFEGLTLTEKTTGNAVLRSPVENGMYPVIKPQVLLPSAMHSSLNKRAHDWHELVGHVGQERLITASAANIGVPAIERKHHKKAGPSDPPTPGQNKCIVLFLDDATRISAVYFLSDHSQFYSALTAYKALVENEQRSRMYRLRLDRAGEDTSTAVVELSQQHGMRLEYSPLHASQSNGAAERLIQELWKVARTMLLGSKLPHNLWAETVSHANWIQNRLPRSRVDMEIPFELCFRYKSDISRLLKFGQPGYAFEYKSNTAKGKKLSPRSLYSFFVGMESNQLPYRLYVPSKQAVFFCRVADLTPLQEEKSLPSMSSFLEGISRQRSMDEEANKPEEADEAEETLARCMYTLSTQSPFARKAKSASTKDLRLPKNFKEACDIPHWAADIDREYEALEERETWRLIPFEIGMYPLLFTWDFRIKEKPGADVAILHKARRCMRGDNQVAYRDYDPDSLYAPVVRHETICMLLAKVVAQGMLLEGADVANAYLYGDLKTPVIMQQPTNSTGIPRAPNHVALVIKSMYGQKEAGHIWGTVRHEKVTSWGFKQSVVDARMYLLRTAYVLVILLIVLDDMAMASNSRRLLDDLQAQLTASFKVKLLGSVRCFIEWELLCTPSAIYFNKRKYIENFAESVNLSHVTPQPTPMPTNADISTIHESDVPLTSSAHARYRSIVGGAMYVAVCTRPDTSFAASVLARQIHAPEQRHLVLFKRLVRYLLGTKDLSHYYPRSQSSQPFTAYTDADWAGCKDTRKSTTGIIVTVNSAPVHWTSKRQNIVSLSSAKAEYIAISMCGKSITWIRRLFIEMLTHEPLLKEATSTPTYIRTDNTAAISLSTNDQVSERNKHIEIKVHYIRELRSDQVVDFDHLGTDDQLADMLTKPFSSARMEYLLCHFMIYKALIN